MRVLVVDDDRVTRLAVGALLRRHFGAEVLEAANGADALTTATREKPDVMLLDLFMPMLDGVGVLRALRAEPAHAKLPVIVMTSSAERHLIGEVIALGITDVLIKPLVGQQGKQRLEAALERARGPHGLGSGAAPRRVLVVDGDPAFRRVVEQALRADFEVREAATGVEGLQMFLEARPAVVCIGAGLGLLQEDRLAGKIRQDGAEDRARVFLCANRDTPLPAGDLYAGIIPRSDDAVAFRRDFLKIALGQAAEN